jgi:hypothetical protein
MVIRLLGTPGPKLTDELRGYLAGYVDGEGCIRISSSGSPTLEITSTFPYTLRLFHSIYGGTLDDCPARNAAHRHAFRWRIYGDSAMAVLDDLMEHLQEKRIQALMVFEIRKTERGHERDGMIAQLSQMKRLDYGN